MRVLARRTDRQPEIDGQRGWDGRISRGKGRTDGLNGQGSR